MIPSRSFKIFSTKFLQNIFQPPQSGWSQSPAEFPGSYFLVCVLAREILIHLQYFVGDKPLVLLVVDPEGFFQLLPHLLLVVFSHELGRHLAEHVETELPRLLLVHLGGVVLHVHLVDLHAHALQDHHHGGLGDGAALLVETIKTFLQRINLDRQKLLLLFNNYIFDEICNLP